MTPVERSHLRLTFLGLFVVSLFAILTMRLWFLQVLAHEDYRDAAQGNEVRLAPIEPPRGDILDRRGVVLAGNRPTNVVAIRLDELRDREATILRLSNVLGLPVREINERLGDRRALPYSAIPISVDVNEDVLVYIRERAARFPGVVTETRAVREYPRGRLAAHLLGYVGEVTGDQLGLHKFREYRQGSIVGRTGVEEAYERDLRGKEGIEKLQVDSTGKTRGSLGRRDAKPGRTLVTTIDARLQGVVEESLLQGILKARTIYNREFGKRYKAPAGGAVVLDPRNGEVLAMASYPDYDPNSFVGGISKREFAALSQDPANPLINRVIQAPFPPGSTFKVVTAAASLQEGLASPGGAYHCSTSFRYADTTFRNWRTFDSGFISMGQALVESCNTVFFRMGAAFWERGRGGGPERLQEYASAFGFGRRSGIDIGERFEAPGVLPDEDWLHSMHTRFPDAFPYDVWLPGYTINLSIGQGDLKVTPLQLANAYATIANGGSLHRPRVGLQVRDAGKLVREIRPAKPRRVPVSESNLGVIRSGLEAVTTRGTARSSFSGFPLGRIPVGAKTGTAELQTIPPSLPYAWFAAYAPAHDPRYVVVVMLEESGHGSETGAPIVRRILEGAFGLRLSRLQTAARVD